MDLPRRRCDFCFGNILPDDDPIIHRDGRYRHRDPVVCELLLSDAYGEPFDTRLGVTIAPLV